MDGSTTISPIENQQPADTENISALDQSSASKGTENFETDKETEQKFNKGERFLLAGAESNPNPNVNVDANKDGEKKVSKQRVGGSTMSMEADATEMMMRDALIETIEGAGIEVSTDWEAGQRVLDAYRELARLMGGGKKKSTSADPVPGETSPFKASFTAEVDAAKVAKNLKLTRKQSIKSFYKTCYGLEGAGEANGVSRLTGGEMPERRAECELTKKSYCIILLGDFNNVNLQKISDYINDVTPNNPYGRRLSERLPQRVERTLYDRAKENAINALYGRASESAVSPHERVSATGRRAIEARKKKALEQWAKATGIQTSATLQTALLRYPTTPPTAMFIWRKMESTSLNFPEASKANALHPTLITFPFSIMCSRTLPTRY